MRWLVFPILLVAVCLASLALLASPLPRPAVSAIVTLSALAAILLLERLTPLHRAWNRRPEGLDLLLLVGNRVLDVAVLVGTLTVLGRVGRPFNLWPTHLPLLAQAGLGIVLAEGFRYALHRLSHRPGLLGRVHATHHAPTRMYTLNGPRLHPGNYAWMAVANTVPMLVLGASLDAVVLAANLTTFFVLFQHANLRLRFDGWNQLLATPDVHRLHHLRSTATGVNYGIVFLGFDRLFGTYGRAGVEPGEADIGPA